MHKLDFKAVEIQYQPLSELIDLTIHEDRHDVTVPFHLQFRYIPSMPYTPIHKIAKNRNTRIKEFYWKLWYGDDATLPSLDLRDTFMGPEVTIKEDAIQTFCSVVGNQAEAFKMARHTSSSVKDLIVTAPWPQLPHLSEIIGSRLL